MNRQAQDANRLPDRWTGEIGELVGYEDHLSDHDTADRMFTDRAEAFNAGRAVATEVVLRARAAQTRGHVVANRAAQHVRETALLAADVNAFSAAQWEIGCELELGDGNRIPVTIDVETATALGQALIAQAALSRQASNAEFDSQMSRYPRSTR
jgi:hypothetical protein